MTDAIEAAETIANDFEEMLRANTGGDIDVVLEEPKVEDEVPDVITPDEPVSDLTLSIITCSPKFDSKYMHELEIFPHFRADPDNRIYGIVSNAGIKNFRDEPEGSSGSSKNKNNALELSIYCDPDEKDADGEKKSTKKAMKTKLEAIKNSDQPAGVTNTPFMSTWITIVMNGNSAANETIKFVHNKATNSLRMSQEKITETINRVEPTIGITGFSRNCFFDSSLVDVVDNPDLIYKAATTLLQATNGHLYKGKILLRNSKYNNKIPGAFGSCTQVSLPSKYNKGLIYRIKYFRNGSINMPGVRDPNRFSNIETIVADLKAQYGAELIDKLIGDEPLIADSVEALLYVRDYMGRFLGQNNAELSYIYTSMYNFIFRVNLQPGSCLNIEALRDYMATKNKPISLREGLYVIDTDYDYNKSDRITFTINTPTEGDLGVYKNEAQHFTYLKFFRRDETGRLAKVNISGASSKEKARLIYGHIKDLFATHYTQFVRYIG